MAGKQITELTATDKFEIDDLMLIRKAGEAEDKKITGANVIKSIGNTAVDGFIATSTVANQINLASVNGSKLDKYYDNMRVSFISPIDSNDAVTVQINTLGFRNFKIINTNNNVTLKANTFVNAIYKAGVFYQTNVSQNVFTNDYYVSGFAKAENNSFTNISLTTAYGVQKKEYYEGMNVVFRCPDYTVGIVRIKIDNIAGGFRDVFQNVMGEGNLTNTANLYKGQIVRLYFDGVDFVLDQFDNTDPKMLINPIIGIDEATQTPIFVDENKFKFLIYSVVYHQIFEAADLRIIAMKKSLEVTYEIQEDIILSKRPNTQYFKFEDAKPYENITQKFTLKQGLTSFNFTFVSSSDSIGVHAIFDNRYNFDSYNKFNMTIFPENSVFNFTLNFRYSLSMQIFSGRYTFLGNTTINITTENNNSTFVIFNTGYYGMNEYKNITMNINRNNSGGAVKVGIYSSGSNNILGSISPPGYKGGFIKFINCNFNLNKFYLVIDDGYERTYYFENCTFTATNVEQNPALKIEFDDSQPYQQTVHLKNCTGNITCNKQPNTSGTYYKYIVE